MNRTRYVLNDQKRIAERAEARIEAEVRAGTHTNAISGQSESTPRGNLPFRVVKFMGLGKRLKVIMRANNVTAVVAAADLSQNTRAERWDIAAKAWVAL